MAISAPSYPSTTAAIVTHVGAYTDTRESAEVTNRNTAISTHEADTTAVHGLSSTAACKGAVVHNGTSYAARPTGFASIEWIGPDDPAGTVTVQNGDTWVDTTP